jgi:1-acyl-sn-glycerol-3-phosphate acyltransferase
VHTVHGVLLVLLRFPRLDRAAREAHTRWWAAKTLALLDVQMEVRGAALAGRKLLVANHVSWLDIMAIHAVCPETRFVSKADVRHWPLASRLADAARTLYIARERKRDSLRVVHLVAEALRAGDTVAVFPEGTTGDGCSLLPFHANLLEAAIASGTPIQPLALRFSDARHTVSPAALYVGDTTLVQSLWRVAAAEGLCVHLHWLPAEPVAGTERRALAALLRGRIAARLAGD